MDMIVERAAALDAHKAQVTACVRVPNDGGERDERIAEFPTTVRGLLALRDWLTGYQVQQVVMEATGVYWRGAVGDPGGRVRVPAGRRPPRQAGPGPQDRRLRRRLAVSTAGGERHAPTGGGGDLSVDFLFRTPDRSFTLDRRHFLPAVSGHQSSRDTADLPMRQRLGTFDQGGAPTARSPDQ